MFQVLRTEPIKCKRSLLCCGCYLFFLVALRVVGQERETLQHDFHRLSCLHTQEGARSRSRSGVHSFSKPHLQADILCAQLSRSHSDRVTVPINREGSCHSEEDGYHSLILLFIHSVNVRPFTRVSHSRFHVGLWGRSAGGKTRSRRGRGPL